MHPIPNPFASRFIQPGALRFRTPEAATYDPTDLVEQLQRHRIGSVIGPHGTGKSTLLATLSNHLQAVGRDVQRFQLSSRTRGPKLLLRQAVRKPGNEIVMIDGFEQLRWWQRRTLIGAATRAGTLLVLTAHRPFRNITTLHRTQVDDALARHLTQERLTDFPETRQLLMERFEQHWRRERPNLRETWFALYDDFEASRCAEAGSPARRVLPSR